MDKPQRSRTPPPSENKRLRSRMARSENDLSDKPKPGKQKETLTESQKLALSYNLHLQRILITLHDSKMRERKEREIVTAMENQQLELLALEEKIDHLDILLKKIELFKQMKGDIERKTEFCEQIIQSIDEEELNNQIEVIEENVNKVLLRNFKLPETDKERNIVLDLLKKISEESNAIPEIKNLIQPLMDTCAFLLKGNNEVNILRKQIENKLKQAEDAMYDELYLKTKIDFESKQLKPREEGGGDNVTSKTEELGTFL